jgi:DNA gyrase subunit B
MQNKIQDYGDDSIQIYAPLEAIRKKVDLYIGRSDNGATALVVKEIIANSIDEYFAGFGDKIEIVLNEKENSITIRDYGRGIPPGKIDSCFTQLHSSGKFEKKEGSSYGASSGTHGLGIKAGSALGKTSAKIFRDGVQYSNSYTWEGKGALQEEKTKEVNGTLITWIPDSEPFHGDNKLNYNDIKDMIEDLSYITPKMKFYLKKNNEKEEIISSKGIKDFLYNSLTTQDLVSPILSFSHQDDYIMVEGALVWTKNKQIERSYVNAVLTQSGGTHITAFKTTLTRELNKFLNSDLKGEEIRRNLSYIINIKTIEELSFSSQSKDSTKSNL